VLNVGTSYQQNIWRLWCEQITAEYF